MASPEQIPEVPHPDGNLRRVTSIPSQGILPEVGGEDSPTRDKPHTVIGMWIKAESDDSLYRGPKNPQPFGFQKETHVVQESDAQLTSDDFDRAARCVLGRMYRRTTPLI